MNGTGMQVFADNSLVYEGSVGPDALAFDGPVGIRSDNARLQVEFWAGPRSGVNRRAAREKNLNKKAAQ
jgi:hypothetical protein